MRWLRGWTPLNRLALAGIVASAAVFAAAARGALRLAAPPPAAAPGAAVGLPALPAPRPVGSDSGILAAVARSPFRADRRRPPDRYHLPGERVDVAARERVAPPPALRLLGTASFEDGSGLAAIAIRGAPPRVIRVGQTLEGMLLVGVAPGTATLTRPDTTLVLHLSTEANQNR
ncbi:MAG TPA: hypothetical protein VF188_03450 [Longimicrobiales bacterium]